MKETRTHFEAEQYGVRPKLMCVCASLSAFLALSPHDDDRTMDSARVRVRIDVVRGFRSIRQTRTSQRHWVCVSYLLWM